MKYTVIVVWLIDGDEIHSDVHTSSYKEIAYSFFKNYCILMNDPSLQIKSVSLFANGDLIDRKIQARIEDIDYLNRLKGKSGDAG